MSDTVAQSRILKDRVAVWYIAVQGHQDIEGAMDRLQDFQHFVKTDRIWGVLHDMRLLKGFPDPGNWSLFTQGVRLMIPPGLRWACIPGSHPEAPMNAMIEAGREAGAKVETFSEWEKALSFVGLPETIEDPLGDVLLLD